MICNMPGACRYTCWGEVAFVFIPVSGNTRVASRTPDALRPLIPLPPSAPAPPHTGSDGGVDGGGAEAGGGAEGDCGQAEQGQGPGGTIPGLGGRGRGEEGNSPSLPGGPQAPWPPGRPPGGGGYPRLSAGPWPGVVRQVHGPPRPGELRPGPSFLYVFSFLPGIHPQGIHAKLPFLHFVILCDRISPPDRFPPSISSPLPSGIP